MHIYLSIVHTHYPMRVAKRWRRPEVWGDSHSLNAGKDVRKLAEINLLALEETISEESRTEFVVNLFIV